MAENGRKKTEFVWDEVKLKVVAAVAKGDRSLNEVLTELKVPERTFYRWKKHPEFQRKIDEIITDIDIAQKSERIKLAKKEIKRILKHLEKDEDKPASRDLIAALKYVGEELGDYEPKRKVDLSGAVMLIDDIATKRKKEDGSPLL